jgi:hypothetical protein
VLLDQLELQLQSAYPHRLTGNFSSTTPSVTRCKHLLTFCWSRLTVPSYLKKFMITLFILLRYGLSNRAPLFRDGQRE